MAAYLIGQEKYSDKLSSQSNYGLLDTTNDNSSNNKDSSNVDTLIGQFQSKSNNTNANNNNNNSDHLQLNNNSHLTLETIWERYLLLNNIPKQFTNSLKTIMGRKRYFQIIKTSHLENLYNQMNVSQCLAQTTFKQWKKLKEEKHKIQLHSECIRLNKPNKMHHNLWKYDIPDILKRIELDVNDFENAMKNIDKRLKIDSGNFKITDILEIFTGWYLDINLFIVLAALAERFDSLESILDNNVHKIGTQSLCLKIRKARELFILIGGLDRKRYFQLSYIFQPIIKLNSGKVTNDTTIINRDLSSMDSYHKPFGHIEMKDLMVFFHAANLSQIHVQQLITYLDNKNNGTIDFVTFLEYLPLFVESHQHIIYNPYLN
uniref:EF-hand domain-containing protein n=1 Tax=Schistosoma haematobium TaxID=6185 RepID=A0A094ZP57_SCHHA